MNTPPSNPQTSPRRIQRLTLTDFRAFPGPAPAHFDFDGKNLLVYGENGAGKSSIFHALKGFFALKPPDLHEHKNVFSDAPDSDCKVSVQFVGDSSVVEWTVSRHPNDLRILLLEEPGAPVIEQEETSDRRVSEATLRCAFLDYRALLDTNYKQGSGSVDLFEIAVEHLLRDYPLTISGGTITTIGALWRKIQENISSRHTTAAINHINQACLEFNTAFRGAFPELIPRVNELMRLLGWPDVNLERFDAPGITYNNARLRQNRAIEGQELIPRFSFRKHPLQSPQLFLNEARLSALGLAIYLAGRLACTPTVETAALKLLVLDDVLIGLDHSNRLPLLDVLREKFADWQIVLLTYDRNWFDLARSHLPESEWKCLEIYAGDNAASVPMPIVYPTQNRPARALLEKAKELVHTPYVEAAANYTRQAFELGVRKGCELKKIEMRYHTDPKAYKAQDFLDKLKHWPGLQEVKKQEWDKTIKELEELKNVVMNPYSHPDAPNIPKAEVEKAIQVVENFLNLLT